MIYGTSHFVSVEAARAYYRGQAFADVTHTVATKLAAGEIHLGPPELAPGESLVMLDNGRRYGIDDGRK